MEKIEGGKILAVHVMHIPSQGGGGSLSILIRHCMQIPGGLAFLRSTRCATALVSRFVCHFVSPEGLTSVGEQLMCRSICLVN
jgi:hypothetical protein